MLSASGRSQDLWVVTTYFNPAGYRSRLLNYQRFRAALDQTPCLTVECALGNRPFELPPDRDILRLRARDTLWHKERLLNLAVATLPPSCRYVAWVDCDVLFEPLDWAQQARALLEHHVAVQLFAEVLLLPPPSHPSTEPARVRSLAATIASDPSALAAGRFDAHGHTGYAWAARRELLAEVGLYDACVVGSADHVMAHALLDEPNAPCVSRLLGKNTPHLRHFQSWASRLRQLSSRLGLSGIGCVPGRIAHLWHGSLADRRYFERNLALQRLGFDPEQDLLATPEQPWQLRDPKGELAEFLRRYFAQRDEDQGL
jgi:hypothetical protein